MPKKESKKTKAIIESIALSEIKTDAGTQIRLVMDEETIQKYHHALVKLKAKFPPIIVFESRGKFYLADGFHRFKAHKMARRKKIECEVRQGTKRDAILYAVGCNADHGLPRTNEDKRKAVLTLLKDKEWSKWSNAQIAKKCKVSAVYVGKLKKKHTINVSSESVTYKDKHGKTRNMKVGNIGRKSKQTTNVYSDAIFEILPKTTAKRLKTYTSKNKMNEVDVIKKAVKLYLESESKRKKK